MEQRLLLNLGSGNWQTGFPGITAQLWDDGTQPVQFICSLPAAPHLGQHYQRWQQLYRALYGSQPSWRRAAEEFEFDLSEPTQVSRQEFETLCTGLQSDLNQWLASPEFAATERQIRTHFALESPIRVMLTAHDKTVLRFPWRLWHFFDDYPNAELSLSLPSYSRSLKQPRSQSSRIRILAVLGNNDGIDVNTDRVILGQLSAAQVTLLAQPTLADLQQYLWETPVDVLFFAGHSTSQGQGYLQVNPTESLTIEQLKFALRRAVTNGLQLAILNSCDGLGLAWNLADLQLPQTIVMREPVPDAIAHQFLKAFLSALAGGQSLYSSVREAREKLHGLTELGVCGPWLPVIVQNPAEEPPTWATLRGQVLPAADISPPGAPAPVPPPPPPRRRGAYCPSDRPDGFRAPLAGGSPTPRALALRCPPQAPPSRNARSANCGDYRQRK